MEEGKKKKGGFRGKDLEKKTRNKTKQKTKGNQIKKITRIFLFFLYGKSIQKKNYWIGNISDARFMCLRTKKQEKNYVLEYVE